jgi:Ca-activated chloride channel family protein
MNCAPRFRLSVFAFVLAMPSFALAKPMLNESGGHLEVMDAKGKSLGSCPLKHTDVAVDISGFIARVAVRQQFHNPFKDKIEAVYVFPLSQDGAVDQMTMKIGDRTIKGQIKERNEARKIYEAARRRGNVASLLDQERPNIFTQSVANIEPGAEIDITISYSETLKWKDGEYEYSFPMVVGPRYMPGSPTGDAATGWSPPTSEVPDADRISPPVAAKGERAGHDISLSVQVNAGLPIQRLESRQHAVKVDYSADKSRATVTLASRKTIPNKDFVLAFQTAGNEIADSVLTHSDSRGKFFTLVLQPPKRVRSPQIVPKEIIFAIDKSGSMMGFPIETAKKAMKLCIEGAHPNDTFNLVCFDGGTNFCFPHAVPNTPENRTKALAYLRNLQGAGGTEMMAAVRACLADQDDPTRVRVVCFMTDGFNGQDMAIIDAVKQNAGTARVFSFGIGSSVNRYLLDNMALAGRGEVHYILNGRDAVGAAERFYERVRTPVLTDVTLDFGSLAVGDVYPKKVPDLFSSTPIIVKGRYAQGGKGTITLRGRTGEGPFERKITVEFPDNDPKNEVLSSLWARAKIEDLMNSDLTGIQQGEPKPAVKEEIIGLGIRYQLMSQFTSFVAVEEKVVTSGGRPRTVSVPVEIPEGVSREGVFGDDGVTADMALKNPMGAMNSSHYSARSMPARQGMGGMGGMGGGMGGGGFFGQADSPRGQKAKDAQAPAPKVEKPAATPEEKLSDDLRKAIEKAGSAKANASFTIGKVKVINGRVSVRVHLTNLTDELRTKIRAMGFRTSGRSSTMLNGSIDIGQLKALSELAEVTKIEPL